MGSVSRRAWIVGASVGVVEALKDQCGLCRWNYTMKSIHQHAKANLSHPTNRKLCFPSSAMLSTKVMEESVNQSEETLIKVMYLSCWGPN